MGAQELVATEVAPTLHKNVLCAKMRRITHPSVSIPPEYTP